MRSITFFVISFLFIASAVNAQTRTINSTGNWSNSGNWISGNIGGAVDNDDDVTMVAGNDITIQNGETYTIASYSVGQGGSLTVDAGGVLIVTGDFDADKDFTINIDGDLTIQGNLNIAKSIQMNITGNLNVEGNVDMAKDAQVDVQGNMTVEGDFTSAKDAQVNVDGTLDVTGDIGLDPGSVITGVGTVTAGSCSGAACASVLPIELIYFNAKVINKKVDLSWATASEENFDYFSIERSSDGKDFKEIAQVTGNGNSYQRIDYTYTDNFPAIGISYYRLRSIDFDGYTEIFDYALVNVEGVKSKAEVFPNPVTSGVLNVQLNFNLEEEAKVLLYNNVGLVELELAIDSWLNPLDVSSLTSGSYLIKIITKQGVFVKRILIK